MCRYIAGVKRSAEKTFQEEPVDKEAKVKKKCLKNDGEKQTMGSPAIGEIPEDEWNLLYVAVTRAKSSLVITKNISNILTLAGEYFLRTELTGAQLTEGQPPRCAVRECQYHITADWPLAMRKLPFKYIESSDDGGPMCGACVLQRIGPTASLLAPPELLQVLPVTLERLELPINYALLMAIF